MKYYLIAPLCNSPLLTYQSNQILNPNDLVQINIRGKQKKGVVLQEVQTPNFECKQTQALDEAFLPHQILLANFIAQYYCAPSGESFGLFTPLPHKNPPAPTSIQYTPNIPLSQPQIKVFESIQNSNFALLFGETGSGKSEVYIHCIIQTLKEGKNALILMPEIALTPQMQSRLQAVFKESLALWHSKISAKTKKETLQKLHEGKVRVLLGARSALFLPLSHLGLIIVDEEHDDSYKSQSRPRYHARDLAIYLGKKLNIRVILGSATPSLKSYTYAKSQNAILSLKKHFFSEIQMDFLNQSTKLTPQIFQAIQNALERNEQIMLFIPTRANFKTLLCQTCAHTITCPFCSVSLSVHFKQNLMRCHYCGYKQAIAKTCPNCGDPHLQSQRIGTAQIAHELQEVFPDLRIRIFDRDHITTQKQLERTLKDFHAHRLDILIGTQMLSKGHDYHKVGLVVVMGIDYILNNPDYRSREKAMSLLFQIKGRGGRKDNAKVLIQTLHQDFFAPFLHDYESFILSELPYREGLYPPYKKLATLTFSDKTEQKAYRKMQHILNLLLQSQSIEVVGGNQALIAKMDSKYRYIILVRADKSLDLLKEIHQCIGKESFEIDMDPLNIM